MTHFVEKSREDDISKTIVEFIAVRAVESSVDAQCVKSIVDFRERSLNDRANGVPILMYTGTVLNVFRTNANKSKLECNARNTYNLKYVIANAKVQLNSIST